MSDDKASKREQAIEALMRCGKYRWEAERDVDGRRSDHPPACILCEHGAGHGENRGAS